MGSQLVGWQVLEDGDIRCMVDKDENRRRSLKRKKGETWPEPSNWQLVSWIWTGGDAAGFKTDKVLYHSV